MQPQNNNPYTIPASIIIAGVIVAGAVFYTNRASTTNNNQQSTSRTNVSAEKIAAVSSADHILGNPDAPVKVVEYSDLECPYCKGFHSTMHQIIDNYGRDGKVAWVYRHLPLAQLHPKAAHEAEASECAAELGGNEKFWAYIDKVFETTPSNNGLDPALLPKIATDIGLNGPDFEACLNSGRYAARIQNDLQRYLGLGIDATPYNFIIPRRGQGITLRGQASYSTLKSYIDQLLN